MPQILYFDLQIEKSKNAYRSRVLSSPVGEASGEFELPFTEDELDRFLSLDPTFPPQDTVSSSGSSPDLTPQSFGERLYAAAFAGEVGTSLRRSLDAANRQQTTLRIRLRIDPDLTELSRLPWEYLYVSPLKRFLTLSDETSLVRYHKLSQPPKPLRVSPPLRVLVVISSPADMPQFDVEAGWSHLKAALSSLQEKNLVQVERLEEATVLALQERLQRGDVHILHFLGHGSFDHVANQGGLYFEDDRQQSNWIDATRLGTLFRDHNALSLIFLNACEGAQTGYSDVWSGTAQQLVQQGIPAVLAMQFVISYKASTVLAGTFYRATANGHSVDAAVAEARKAVYLAGNEVEWATPILFSRSPDNRLFELPQDRISGAPNEESIHEISSSAEESRAGTDLVALIQSQTWPKLALIGIGAVIISLGVLFLNSQSSSVPESAASRQPTVAPTATPQPVVNPVVEPTAASTRLCSDGRQCVLVAEIDLPDDERYKDIVRKIYWELTSGELLSSDMFNVRIIDAIRDVDQIRQLTEQEMPQIIVWGQIIQLFKELNINFELINQLGVGQSNQLRPYRVQFFEPITQKLTCTGECFEPANLGKALNQLGEVVAHTTAGMLHYGLAQAEEADQDFGIALYCIGEPVNKQNLNLTNVDCGQDLQIEGFNAGALYYYAGRAKILIGDYVTAIEYLQKAALQNPDDPAPLIGIATAYKSWIDEGNPPAFHDALDEAVLLSNVLRTDRATHNVPTREIAVVDYELGFIAELQETGKMRRVNTPWQLRNLVQRASKLM
ncbi:CHAT domain-containing protein [Chloroflexi bacterium TSY]|nr:CHAT domain-containing protein [Chloroflexi bacterium TSY]